MEVGLRINDSKDDGEKIDDGFIENECCLIVVVVTFFALLNFGEFINQPILFGLFCR